MRRIQLSGSSLWRAAICPGSAVLERVPEVSEWADAGSGMHAFLCDVNRIGRDAALAAVEDPDKRAAFELIDVARLPVDPAAYAAEVAYAYDVATGKARSLGYVIGRKYVGLTPTEIPCTLDVVALVGKDAVFYGDYKGPWKYVEAPPVNWQFRFGALCLARAHGRTRAIVEMIRMRDGVPYREDGELDLFDLAQIAEDVRELHTRVVCAAAAEEPPVRIGAHCDGCEARSNCRPRMALLWAATHDPDAQIVGLRRHLSEEHLVDAFDQVASIERLAKEMREELEAAATARPFRLRDGQVFGPIERTKSSPEGKAAWHFFAEKVGEEEAWKRVKLVATWESVEALARETSAEATKLAKEADPKAKKVTIKSVMAGYEDDLEQRGAVKTSKPFVVYGPHKPKAWQNARGALPKMPAGALLSPPTATEEEIK